MDPALSKRTLILIKIDPALQFVSPTFLLLDQLHAYFLGPSVSWEQIQEASSVVSIIYKIMAEGIRMI